MKDSLCGKTPCPRVCVRVCHCPAGLARSHEHFAMYRNRREMSQGRASPSRPCPPNVDPTTGEISEARHFIGKIKEQALFNLFGPPQFPKHRKPSKYGGRLLSPYASTAILAGLLTFIGIVVLLGLLINQGDFAPNYEPQKGNYYEDW